MTQPESLPLGPALDTVTVRPGDTLIVRLDGDLEMERLRQIVDRFQAELPGVKVMVINAAQILVYRPES